MGKLDLNKLKDEIDNRKKIKAEVSIDGTGGVVGAPPRDVFLNGLLESLSTGKDTQSSILVKSVDNLVTKKNGGVGKLPIDKTVIDNPRQPANPALSMTHSLNEVTQSADRDEQLFAEFKRMKANNNKTLADSIENYSTTPTVGASMNQPNAAGQVLNEAYLNEKVNSIVDGRLVENLGLVMEEAMKNTIIEMYAVERIKTVLHENKELIRTVVIDTIKEIQLKNRNKK